MSIKVMSAVWADSEAKQGQLLVLLAIADFADDDGMAWPSVATLARKARLKERRTHEILGELQQMGELEIVKGAGPNGVNKYGVKRGGALIAGGAPERAVGVRPSAPNPSCTRQHVPKDKEPQDFQLSAEEAASDPKRPGSLTQVIDYCAKIGLPQSDAEYFWFKWLGNGFKNAGKAIANWKAVIRSAKAGGFAPSTRGGKRYETKSNVGAGPHRGGDKAGHGADGGEGASGGLPIL